MRILVAGRPSEGEKGEKGEKPEGPPATVRAASSASASTASIPGASSPPGTASSSDSSSSKQGEKKTLERLPAKAEKAAASSSSSVSSGSSMPRWVNNSASSASSAALAAQRFFRIFSSSSSSSTLPPMAPFPDPVKGKKVPNGAPCALFEDNTPPRPVAFVAVKPKTEEQLLTPVEEHETVNRAIPLDEMPSRTVSNDSNEPLSPSRRISWTLSASNHLREDKLLQAGTKVFDEKAMAKFLPPDMVKKFMASSWSGDATDTRDQELIAAAMFKWARDQGAIDFAHWFFPARGGGGASGGQLGAYKMDTLIDLHFASPASFKPIVASLPAERLFQGESDGSSFPNGGSRQTHCAAAFTCWDRASPPVIFNKVLRLPCAFITHTGKTIDDKIPLLRSFMALENHGLRFLKAIGIEPKAKHIVSYLGWEQQFYIVPADLYKRRPDLLNCGRTLIGRLPVRHEQSSLNFLAPLSGRVAELLARVQTIMLELGVPVACRHNSTAPSQLEISAIFRAANHSADSNVLFMEVLSEEASKLGLVALFHEKPFKGINGSSKDSNWSVGTDTGVNFFNPGKTEDSALLFVTAMACLAHGINQHGSLLRCSLATAGNDHNFGSQDEAKTPIISLYTGMRFEAHVDSIIAGNELLGFSTKKRSQFDSSCNALSTFVPGIEDRNGTTPFPFCGNRFELRAMGSSQNCAFPITVCNTIFASGMAHLARMIEGGMSHRDAVADVFEQNRGIMFSGNTHSEEWLAKAAKLNIPNLGSTPQALDTWMSPSNVKLFEDMKVLTADEAAARHEMMFESYCTDLTIEAETMVVMVESGILPACAKDLASYKHAAFLSGDRQQLYKSIFDQLEKLKTAIAAKDLKTSTLSEEAHYFGEVIKPSMQSLRSLVDKAEAVLPAKFYPFPKYDELLYSHHHNDLKAKLGK